MLKQRVLTGILGLTLIIVLNWFGSPWFSFLIAGITLIGTFEFYRLDSNFNNHFLLLYLGIFFSVVLALNPHYPNIIVLPVLIAIILVVSLLCLFYYQSRQNKVFSSWAWMIAGGVYIGWMLSYWISLRFLDNGRVWVYLAMFIIFVGDTGAFFIGRKWGRNKLAVTISPQKTWEGAIGGVVSAILGASIVFIVLGYIVPLPLNYWQLISFAVLINIFAQFGDLVESLIKRNAGVKESGTFLPGHGGILDRFDSHIFVGVLAYHYILAFSSQWPSWLW